jgi:hypothetical protein
MTKRTSPIKAKGIDYICALPGDGWKLKNVANLFMVATNAEKHSYLIWKDGTIQSLPNKPQ